MVGLFEKIDKLSHDAPIAAVEESGGDTRVTSTTGTTNSVHIVVNISGQVVVHDVGNVGDIKTTGSHSSSDQDRASAVSEHLKSTLTLTLGAVTMNGSGGELLVDEEVGQRIRHALGLDEDKCQTSSVSVQNV